MSPRGTVHTASEEADAVRAGRARSVVHVRLGRLAIGDECAQGLVDTFVHRRRLVAREHLLPQAVGPRGAVERALGLPKEPGDTRDIPFNELPKNG